MKKVPVRNNTGIPPTTWGWSIGTRNAWLVSKILENMSGNPLLLLGEYGTFSLRNKERGEWSDSEKTMWKHYNLRKLLFYAICVLCFFFSVFVYSMSYKVYNNFFNIDMYVNVTNHLYNMASALSHGLFQADN